MKILVLNPGSSSLKRAVYEFPGGRRRAGAGDVDAVGIRVVHGGSRFVKPAIVDDAVVEEISNLAELAPLHNPLAVKAIEETRRKRPGVPIVAVFDTAFHHTLPPVASRYAVPQDLGVRRYGFHGISYSYVSKRRARRQRHIICHLGNGASVCAISRRTERRHEHGLHADGRAGDGDARRRSRSGRHPLSIAQGRSEADLDELLNHQSGLRGLSGISGDVRELEAARAGDAHADFALDVFAYRAANTSAPMRRLGGVDASPSPPASASTRR